MDLNEAIEKKFFMQEDFHSFESMSTQKISEEKWNLMKKCDQKFFFETNFMFCFSS